MVNGSKGQLNSLLTILIMAFLLGGIIVIYYTYSLAVPFISKTTNELVSTTQSIAPDDGNITDNLAIATKPVAGINQVLSWFGYFALFFCLIGFLIIAYNVRTHPYMAVFWIALVLVLALLSMWLSNSYYELKIGDSYMRDAYESNVVNDFVMTYLPHIVVFFGLVGGVFLFVLISRDPEMEASYV
jgi:hypothetical protein